jgi:hypothetical protein
LTDVGESEQMNVKLILVSDFFADGPVINERVYTLRQSTQSSDQTTLEQGTSK